MNWRGLAKKLRWKRLILVVAVLYVAALSLACAFPDRLLLIPSRYAIDLPGGSSRMIQTPVGQVQVWIMRCGQPPQTMRVSAPAATQAAPEAYILAFNGNGSRAEREPPRLEPMWAHHCIEIWAMNYPGYGASSGKALVKNIAPAALAAYDALAKEAHGKPIFISGHSLGTAAALYVAANRPVAGLVLHNAPPLRPLIVGRFSIYSLWIGAHMVAAAVPPELDSLANGKRCTAPAVFLMANKDTLVLPKYQQMVYDAYAGPKRVIHLSGYGHNEAVETPEFPEVQAAIEWLLSQSSARPSAPPVLAQHEAAPQVR